MSPSHNGQVRAPQRMEFIVNPLDLVDYGSEGIRASVVLETLLLP